MSPYTLWNNQLDSGREGVKWELGFDFLLTRKIGIDFKKRGFGWIWQ